jgi:hypothetical protein
MAKDKGGLMSREAQERLIRGAKKGGEKGGPKGGRAPKHFTAESKDRQIQGARKGGLHSHRGRKIRSS